ncbi:unnamed protein product [Lepeophtheirus salmonis]|uniref:(salmon louse) hypothetical protein n=1 Tax=Lepeophtheirus salmonis TaxID=72036 RepID=A0A7R8CC69_LEPSM|nr:unnamed protein product [Lepeophtheirus salmonis]CAF2767632.1 unnamed protein product [Lepeophtheirus salmonis]
MSQQWPAIKLSRKICSKRDPNRMSTYKIMEKLCANKEDYICTSTPLETIIEKEEDLSKACTRRPLRIRNDFISGRFAKKRTLEFVPYWIQDKDKIHHRKKMLKKHRRSLKLNALTPRKIKRLDSLLSSSETMETMEEKEVEMAAESSPMDLSRLSSVFNTQLNLGLTNQNVSKNISKRVLPGSSTFDESLREKVRVRRSSRLISRDCLENYKISPHDGSIMKEIDKEKRPLRQKNNNLFFTKNLEIMKKEKIETDKGSVLVALKGDPSQPALVTYHDLGLNYVSNFQAFFNYPDMAELLRKFYIVHINAPGQEEGAEVYPDTFKYPSLEELAEQINEILNNLKIVKYIGLGVGLGGNILLRHAKDYPERIEGLMLISTVCTTAGWIEWGYQKWNISYMRSHGITQSVVDYLMWHHFGYNPAERPSDLTNVFKHYFENDVQPVNLAKLCEQYIWRTQINIDRDISLQNITNNNNNTTKEDKLIENKSLQVPTLNICGAYNPFIEETVTLNSKLSPDKSSWMKIQDCGMAIEEQPAKVSEAFRLFLQGLGFCLSIRKTSSVGVVS